MIDCESYNHPDSKYTEGVCDQQLNADNVQYRTLGEFCDCEEFV